MYGLVLGLNRTIIHNGFVKNAWVGGRRERGLVNTGGKSSVTGILTGVRFNHL